MHILCECGMWYIIQVVENKSVIITYNIWITQGVWVRMDK